MRFYQKILCVVVLMVSAFVCAIPAVASSYQEEYQGLKVMVTMDKEEYEAGEPITATITVVNVESSTITILNLEQLIPEGYVLSENSEVSTQNVEVKPGQTIELQVTFEGEPADPAEAGEGTFWDKIFYGEFWGVPNIIWIVLGVIGFIIYMVLT